MGLAAHAQLVLKQNPASGAVFCYRGRRGDRLKLLFWDGQGFCLYYNHSHSYYTSFLSSRQFCVAVFICARGDPVDEAVPSAALLLGQVGSGEFVEGVVAVVGMADAWFVTICTRRDGAPWGRHCASRGQRAQSRRSARYHLPDFVLLRGGVSRFFAGHRTTSCRGSNLNRSVPKPCAPLRWGDRRGGMTASILRYSRAA